MKLAVPVLTLGLVSLLSSCSRSSCDATPFCPNFALSSPLLKFPEGSEIRRGETKVFTLDVQNQSGTPKNEVLTWQPRDTLPTADVRLIADAKQVRFFVPSTQFTLQEPIRVTVEVAVDAPTGPHFFFEVQVKRAGALPMTLAGGVTVTN
jgi:hypothetical protein